MQKTPKPTATSSPYQGSTRVHGRRGNHATLRALVRRIKEPDTNSWPRAEGYDDQRIIRACVCDGLPYKERHRLLETEIARISGHASIVFEIVPIAGAAIDDEDKFGVPALDPAGIWFAIEPIAILDPSATVGWGKIGYLDHRFAFCARRYSHGGIGSRSLQSPRCCSQASASACR